MDGDGTGYGAGPAEERRRAAVIAFLGAGLSSAPSKALAVSALAAARCAVSVRQVQGQPLDEWLAGEVRMRGIRENAAVLAVLELPGRREETARVYRDEHPDRAGVLADLLAVIGQRSPGAG